MSKELKEAVYSFFTDYLDYTEESDSGKIFHPIEISCCRATKVKDLENLLDTMKELSGAKETK